MKIASPTARLKMPSSSSTHQWASERMTCTDFTIVTRPSTTRYAPRRMTTTASVAPGYVRANTPKASPNRPRMRKSHQ